jgi:hypothetical protein
VLNSVPKNKRRKNARKLNGNVKAPKSIFLVCLLTAIDWIGYRDVKLLSFAGDEGVEELDTPEVVFKKKSIVRPDRASHLQRPLIRHIDDDCQSSKTKINPHQSQISSLNQE